MVDLFENSEKIYNEKTRNYFQEVLSSYNNKNYRSAVVMLYSIVIYDIVCKLKELDEIYNQDWAKKIIKEINTIRKDKPRSPEWETTLLDRISKQQDFLSLSIIEEINHLKTIRNQCAHPAIDNNDELFAPSRYEADALISRMLDEVLTIPAMFTNKITDYITEQIAKIAGYSQFRWKDRPQLSKSFNKYFKRMNDHVYIKVFKDMWRLTYFVSNEECDKNRFANMIFLDIMLNDRHSLLVECLKDEQEYFNKISSDPQINKYLTILIYRNNYILSFIDETTRALIKNSKFELPDVQLFAWFVFDSKEEYIDNLVQNKKLHEYADIIIDSYKNDSNLYILRDYFRKSLIKIYLNSSDFDEADKNFNNFIYPIIEDFSKEEILNLIRMSENNPQLTRRYSYLNANHRNKMFELVDKVGIKQEDIENFEYFKRFYVSRNESNDNENINTTIEDDDLPF